MFLAVVWLRNSKHLNMFMYKPLHFPNLAKWPLLTRDWGSCLVLWLKGAEQQRRRQMSSSRVRRVRKRFDRGEVM